ncbi:MAG: NADH-quinone oxidoreductase subunit NuoK [Planctomycetes bacterium]|nr:NADH-quinone oxidoreductase subunit NuoK [Planctomycetota bacterium]MCC6408731.1 NADH-quinone oxidoreductase subunit NuoK [Planctomycetota bacterium]
MTLVQCLLLASALFSVGVYGLITRRQAVAMLLSIELMVNAANLALVAFAKYAGAPTQPLVLFTLAITVAEVAVGLALVMLLYRRYDDTLLDAASETKG